MEWHYPTLGKDLVLWDLVVLSIVLVVLIFLGVWAIVWVKRWRQIDTESDNSLENVVASYRELLDQGLLRQEEFDRIQTKLDKPANCHPEVPDNPQGEAPSSPPPKESPP